MECSFNIAYNCKYILETKKGPLVRNWLRELWYIHNFLFAFSFYNKHISFLFSKKQIKTFSYIPFFFGVLFNVVEITLYKQILSSFFHLIL